MRQRQKGFTLLELMIALMILSIMLMLAYSSLRTIFRSSAILTDRREARLFAQAVLGRLSTEVQLAQSGSSLYPTTGSCSANLQQQGQFRGTPINFGSTRGDSITFIAQNAAQFLPDRPAQSGLTQITYRVSELPAEELQGPEDRRLALVREEIPRGLACDDAMRQRMFYSITKNLAELRFSYFDSRNEQWHDEWDENQSGIPALVRITVRIISPAGNEQVYVTSVALPNVERG